MFSTVNVPLFDTEKEIHPCIVILLGDEFGCVFLASKPLLEQSVECIHMAYFFLVQFINTLNNPVVGIGQNDLVFLSGFVMNRINITDFAIAMVFLGGFIVDRIGITNFANHSGSGGGGGGKDGGDDGVGGGRGSNSSALGILQILGRFIILRKVRSYVSLGLLLA